ncbi:MAG: hypothetical protein ABIQ95_08315, partial [Bdellovibrionia bacterium]
MNRLRASIPAILPYLCIVYCFSACKQYGAAEDSSPLQSSSQSAPQPEKTPQTVTDAEFGRLTSAGYLVPTDMPSLDDRKVIEQYKASRDAGFAGAAIAADLMVIQDFVDQNPSAASLKNSFLHNNSDDPNGNLQVVDSDTDIDKNPPVKFMDGDFQITSVANSIRKSQDLENQKSILKAILSKGDTAVASQLNLSLRAVDEMKDLSEVDGAINTALARNYAASPLDTIKSWYIEPQRNGYPTKCHNDEIGRGKGWDSNIINLLFLDNSLKLNKFSLEPEGSFEDGPMGRFNFPLKGSLP